MKSNEGFKIESLVIYALTIVAGSMQPLKRYQNMWWTTIMKSLMEKVEIANQNSRKWHLERKISKGNVIQLTNWITKINFEKFYFKREKPNIRIKHQRIERHSMEGVFTKVKLQVCNVSIIEIVNKWDDIEAQ